MFLLEQAIEAARRDGVDVWVAGPASSREVERLERVVGTALPGSYRHFLCSVGAISLHESLVSGIVEHDSLSLAGGSLFGETERSRNEQGLPPGLLVLQPDGDAPYCLQVSNQHEEMPVVCYQVNTASTEQIASSFSDWLERFVFGAGV